MNAKNLSFLMLLIIHESTPKIIVPESAQNQYKIWAEYAERDIRNMIFSPVSFRIWK